MKLFHIRCLIRYVIYLFYLLHRDCGIVGNYVNLGEKRDVQGLSIDCLKATGYQQVDGYQQNCNQQSTMVMNSELWEKQLLRAFFK